LLIFVATPIWRATKIIVADSPAPYAMIEYNMNFTKGVEDKVEYVGHFSAKRREGVRQTDLGRLIDGEDFGYWMRTGNRSTNDATGKLYEEAFRRDEMGAEKRVVSHARNDPSINRVRGMDGRSYSVAEALEKKIDWVQIDIGFLSDDEKDAVLSKCKYAVVNGSHTVMGEIIGDKSKPIIGLPIYDEHTNQIRWAQERNLGVLAGNTRQVVSAISRIRGDYSAFEDALRDYSRNFLGSGAQNAARIAARMLEKT